VYRDRRRETDGGSRDNRIILVARRPSGIPLSRGTRIHILGARAAPRPNPSGRACDHRHGSRNLDLQYQLRQHRGIVGAVSIRSIGCKPGIKRTRQLYAIGTTDGGKRIPDYAEVKARVEGDVSVDLRDQLLAEKARALRKIRLVTIDDVVSETL
jgi:hypothetical protein